MRALLDRLLSPLRASQQKMLRLADTSTVSASEIIRAGRHEKNPALPSPQGPRRAG